MKKILMLAVVALVAVMVSCGSKEKKSEAPDISAAKPLIEQYVDLAVEFTDARSHYGDTDAILSNALNLYYEIGKIAEKYSDSQKEAALAYIDEQVEKKHLSKYDFNYFDMSVEAFRKGEELTRFSYDEATGDINYSTQKRY